MRTILRISVLLLMISLPVRSIYNGNNVKPGRFEWNVALFEGSNYVCSGALISATHILTAASCVTAELDTAVAGEYNLSVDEGPEETRNIINKIIHPDYFAELYLNDIAILEVDEIPLSNNIQAIQVLDSTSFTQRIIEENRLLRSGSWGQDYYYATGWGLPDSMRELKMIAIPNDVCASAGYYVTANTTCLLPRKYTGFCDNDEGAPIATQRKNEWVLAFIYSFRNIFDGCTQGMKSGTTVANYADWINSYIS